MHDLIDTSQFPVGDNLDYTSPVEVESIRVLEAEVWDFLHGENQSKFVADVVFAFGLAPKLGLFLLRFKPGGKPEDAERWAVVGDLPPMHFETDDTPTPALALKLYCAIAQDWADNVIAGNDLSDSYPIEAAPTQEHAEMVLGRIDFIRTHLIPLAVPPQLTLPRNDKRLKALEIDGCDIIFRWSLSDRDRPN